MSALRELLAIFDIKVDEKELEHGSKSINEFQEKLEKIAKTVGEVFLGRELFEFIKGTVEADAHLQDLATRLDISAQFLRSFGRVAEDAGVDSESAANALGLLQKNLGEASTKGGETAAAFAKLGVALKNPDGSARDLREVLGEVADGMSALPGQNERAAVAMQLFGRSGRELVPVLSKFHEGLDEALAEADALGNGLGDAFYANVKKAADGFEMFAFGLQSLKDRAIAAILPAIEDFGKLLKTGVEWLLEADKKTHVVQATFVALAVVVGGLFASALGTAAAAAWALVAPFLPLAAAIAAVVWVVQDLFAAMNGGESVIGDVVEKLGGVGAKTQFVAQLKDAWDATTKAINSTAYGLGFFIGLFAGFGKVVLGSDIVKTIFLDIVKAILAAGRALAGFISAVAAIPQAIHTGSLKPITDVIDKTGDAIFGKGGIFGDAGLGQTSSKLDDYGVPAANLGMAPRLRKGASGSVDTSALDLGFDPLALTPRHVATLPLRGGAGGSPAPAAAPHVQQTNHYDVTVHTASDQPKAVGDAVGTGISSQGQKDLEAALVAAVRQ